MKAMLKSATLAELTFVAANARAIDKREVLASGPRSMTEAGYLTWHMTENIGGIAYSVWIDDVPHAVFGFTRQSPLTPWLFSAWAWGTDKMGLCMPTMAAWAQDRLIPEVEEWGMRRIEARSSVEHTEAHRWLLWMHFKREADLVEWGRDGADFVLFAWTRSRFKAALECGEARGIAKEAGRFLLG